MSYQLPRIIRQDEARTFMEGLEECREYVKTPKIWFGTSMLKPGERGDIDVGHTNSQEVFFVCQGHVKLFDEKEYHELFKGDAVLIPEGVPHTLINVGEELALVAWAGAPGE